VRSLIGKLRPGKPQQPVAVADAADEKDPRSNVIDAFLSRLTVTTVGESRLVDAKFTAESATFARKAINGLADQYILQTRDQKFAASQDPLDWLNTKLTEQKAQLETSE